METKWFFHRIFEYDHKTAKIMKNIYKILLALLLISYLGLNDGFSQNPNYFNSSSVDISPEFNALIYPNPIVDNRFFVKSDKTIKIVEVINVIGQSVKRVTNDTNLPYNILVELNNCEPGMYMIKITSEENQTIIKKVLLN